MKDRSHLFLFFLTALGLSFLLFGNGISGDFVFDDGFVITGNPLIGQINKTGELLLSPYHYKQPETGIYRPLTVISYSFNEALFGPKQYSFHVINIILHAVVSFLIYKLLLRFTKQTTALISSVLFLFLPIHVEAVTSIIGRAEILAALFVLLALNYAFEGKKALGAICLLAGLLSKEIAIAFLPIYFFIIYKRDAKISLKSIKEFLYYGIALTAYGLMRFIALGHYFLSNDATVIYNPIKYASFFEGLYTAIKISWLYIQKSFIPIGLSSDYSYDQIPIVKNIFTSSEALAGVAILILICIMLFYKKQPELQYGSAIFLSSFFVISNFVFKTGTIMAERLMYLPSIGLVLITAFALKKLIDKNSLRYFVWAGLMCVLIFYSIKIVDRNKSWLNEEALFTSAFNSAPNSVVNQTNYAYLYFKKNDISHAKEQIDKTIAIAPEHIGALNLGGEIYQSLGDYKTAEKLWLRTVALKPTYLRGIRSLGNLYYKTDNYQKAEEFLNHAIEMYPRWNEVFLLSLTETKLAKYSEAIGIIEKYFGKNPENNNLKFALGFAYYRNGDKEKAWYYFNQSRNTGVSEKDFIKALDNI